MTRSRGPQTLPVMHRFALVLAVVAVAVACSDPDEAGPACPASPSGRPLTIERELSPTVDDLVGGTVVGCLRRGGASEVCLTKSIARLDLDGGSVTSFGGDPEDTELRARGFTVAGLVGPRDGKTEMTAEVRLSEGAASSTDSVSLTVTTPGGAEVVDVRGDVRWSDDACNRTIEPAAL